MRTLPALLCIGLLAPALASAQALFSDDFSDGNRNGWNIYGFRTGDSAASNSWVITNPTTTTSDSLTGVSYFSSKTLAVGEKLTLSMSVSVSALSTNTGGIRIGLFDSAGSQISGDSTATTSATWQNYRGYVAQGSLMAAGTPTLQIRERTGTNVDLFGSGANIQLGGNQTISTGAISPVSYAFSLVVERTGASSVSITSTLGGLGTITRTDTTAASVFTTFDTLGFWVNNGRLGTLTIDDVSVSAIPEPSSFAALAALAVGGFVVTRRRRR